MPSHLPRIWTIRGTDLIFKNRSITEHRLEAVWHYWKHYQKFGLEDGNVGRPRIFCQEQMRAVVDYVIAEFRALQPASCNRVVDYARTEFHLDILPGTLGTILLRDERLKPVVEFPMEMQRARVSPDEIPQYFEKPSIVLDGQGDGGQASEETSHVEDSNVHMWL
jgi:hypothetical protein